MHNDWVASRQRPPLAILRHQCMVPFQLTAGVPGVWQSVPCFQPATRWFVDLFIVYVFAAVGVYLKMICIISVYVFVCHQLLLCVFLLCLLILFVRPVLHVVLLTFATS